jgi:ribosomal protein S18 acetylase RimI-like enzyme
MKNLPENTTIRRYSPADEAILLLLIEAEGEEWRDYWHGEGRKKYAKVLTDCICYLIFEGDTLCGYARCREDGGFGVYVIDLLVNYKYRGKGYGNMLLAQACKDFPDSPVYAMSDVDPYYEKQGYERIGSIFRVKAHENIPNCDIIP